MIKTEAWVLSGAKYKTSTKPQVAELVKESFVFSDIAENELLVEPIYGCWEGNMSHAIERSPIDICHERNEERVVIGNAGVVRVLKIGANVKTIKVGQYGVVFCNGISDQFGYPKKIYGYDAPESIGLLAKQTKLNFHQIIPIPAKSNLSLPQWAAFSLRYITAWANWKVAYGCWRQLITELDLISPHVWGWGGGVTLAELTLAKIYGCKTAMIASNDARLNLIKDMGITPIDRRQFNNLDYDECKYQSDPVYQKSYLGAESAFLDLVMRQTDGIGVSIFIDYIGSPVFRATIKALSRQGIVTTAGWKKGMKIPLIRAIECINWHTHVHTHYARYSQGVEAVDFAENHEWAPPITGKIYRWEEIPVLAKNYAAGEINDYFPIFEINQP